MLRRRLMLVLVPLALLMLGSSLVSVVAMGRALAELQPGPSSLVEPGPADRLDRAAAAERFRRSAVVLAVIHVVLLNLAVLVLLRAATLVLRPVDKLVLASRALAREDFTHRVEVRRGDEFDELAVAFNRMAERMESNEARKVETLHQVARTLSHELNNAIAIIELQLRLVQKSPGYDRTSGERLRRIHEALSHMHETIASLQGVRRVVLTEYTRGVPMLDLERSTRPDAVIEPRPIDTTPTGKAPPTGKASNP